MGKILTTKSRVLAPLLSVHHSIFQLGKGPVCLADAKLCSIHWVILTTPVKVRFLRSAKKIVIGNFILLLNKHLLVLTDRTGLQVGGCPKPCSKPRSDLPVSRWSIYLLQFFCFGGVFYISIFYTTGKNWILHFAKPRALISVERNLIYGKMWK